MSTRCQVLYMIQNSTGTWDAKYSWYHHYDGYPSNMWPELKGIVNLANQYFKENVVSFLITLNNRFKYYGGYEFEQEDCIDFIPCHGDLDYVYFILDYEDHLELKYVKAEKTLDLNIKSDEMIEYDTK